MSKSILDIIIELWDTFSSAFDGVYVILSTPLQSLVDVNVPVVEDILKWLVETMNIQDYTIITLMFGVGLPLLIGLTLVKWFADIIT